MLLSGRRVGGACSRLALSDAQPSRPPRSPSPSSPSCSYRLHVSLEDIAADADLRALLVDMLQAAQRYHGVAHGTG